MSAPRRGLAALVAGTALLAGCAALPGPERRAEGLFVLDTTPTLGAPTAERFRCLTLLVSPLRSAPGYGTARMVYSEAPHRLQHFAHHRWVDSPARMLAPLIVETLQRSGLFAHTVMGPSPAEAELRLDARVTALRQRILDDGRSEVELRLEVTLVDTRSGQLLGATALGASAPAAASPDGGAAAANAATAKVLTQLVQFLARALERSAVDCPAPARPAG
jgi:cholesterol transport system auxiliary component